MVQLKYKNEVYAVPPGQTVLDTLLEQGHDIPNNCRAGACQSCLMQVTKGNVPEQAQKGLKDSHKAKGYFLACSCIPEEDIDISLPDADQLRVSATVSQIESLSDDVMELKIKTAEPYEYHAGQYVTLWRDEHSGRTYSLASLPSSDDTLNFQIKLIPGGVISSWVHDELQVGDTVSIQGPAGDCFYTPGNAQQNLLLIGTGTGLSPLYGIVRDALDSGHTGDIHLFHGALTPAGLYLHDKLVALEQQYANFHYHPCVLHAEENMPDNIVAGDISKIAHEIVPDPSGWRAFLCGDQGLVNSLRKQIFLAGCSMKDIYSDPFIFYQGPSD
jgi:CDP-4-dehydro-6-deoxyglucose reductase, E3